MFLQNLNPALPPALQCWIGLWRDAWRWAFWWLCWIQHVVTREGRSAPSALWPSGRSHAGARSYLPLRVNGFTYPRLPFFTSLVTLALTPSVWGAGTADLDGTHMFSHRTWTLRSSFQHTHRFSCPRSPRPPVAVKAQKRSVNPGGSAAPLTRPSASPLIWLVCVRQLGGSAGASRVASIQVRPPNTYSAHHLIKSLSDPMCTLA